MVRRMPLLNARPVGLAVPFMLLGLLSCQPSSPLANSGTTIQAVQYTDKVVPIASLQQSSTVNSIVYLKGRVGDRAPLLGAVAYELRDATGSIWVLSKEAIANPGDEVTVKGKLQYQSIPLNGKEQGAAYVEQQQLLQHTPAIKS